MNAIINTKLILEDGIIFDGAITWENGRILQADSADKVTILSDAQVIDAGGLYTAPGLVDLHNHGCGDYLYYEDPLYCSRHFLKHGQTTVLPTLYSNISLEDMLAGAERIRQASASGAGRNIGGLYMEGPYMNSDGGFQNAMKWNGPINSRDYIPLVEGLGDMVRVWAVDPIREGIGEFIEYAKTATPHACFAYGHTDATAEDCRRVRHHGFTLQTHWGDTGSAPGRAQGTPGAGVDQYALYDPDLYSEVICDATGIHVVPDLIKMLVRTKGVEHVCLITDSMCCRENYKNNEAEGIWYGPDLNYDDEGHLAGSRLTLDNACRNLMTHTGYGLCHAIRMATLNPAKVLKMDHQIGSLAPGKLANLILIDDMVNVHSVILEGTLAVHKGDLLI